MIRFLAVVLLMLSSFAWIIPVQGQEYTVSITGTTNVQVGTSYTYNVVWRHNGTVTTAPAGGVYNWDIYGGTSPTSGSNYAVIIWSGSGSAIFEYTAGGTTYSATITATNSSCTPTPSLSFSLASSTCPPRALSYTGTPPAGVTWYWQTSATGTSMANSSTSYSVTTAGTYYVRPYNTAASCWGTAASYAVSTVETPPATPASPVVGTELCGSKSITHSTPPAGVTWYWQGTNPNGTSTGNSTVELAMTTGVYFLRARDNSTGCWSLNAASASVTINDPPAPAAPATTTNTCGPQTLSKNGTPPSNVLWYWQGKDMGGMDYTSATAVAATYTATSSGTYYLRPRNADGCWGPPASVNVNVYQPPAPTGVTDSQITSSSFRVSWNSVAGVDGYTVEVSSTNDFSTILKTLTTAGTFIDVTALDEGSTNYFRVRANKDCSSSENSTPGIALLIPPAPLATTATNIQNASFYVNWQPSNGATGYYFDIATSANFTAGTFVYGNVSTSSSEGFSGNPNGPIVVYTNISTYTNTYYYRIRAVNASGVSANSNVITILQAPHVPVATPATDVTYSSFTANWDAAISAAEYRLDISTSPEFTAMISGYNDRVVNGTSIAVPGLNMGVVYYYRVRSKNVSGTSASSNVIEVRTWKNYNYIVTTTVAKPDILTQSDITAADIGEINVKYDYFDGIGRPVQSANKQASPQGKDVIQPIVYDPYGREVLKYLPYVSASTDAAFQQRAITDQQGYYSNGTSDKTADDVKPYAVAILEPSPLNRVLKQGAAGEAWQPQSDPVLDRSVKKFYPVNTGEKEVRLFTYNSQTETVNLEEENYYLPNRLSVNKTVDEQGNEVIEYIDKEGRTVLKKVQYEKVGDERHYASTYYIYDDYGNLVVVLPPESVKNLTVAP